MKCREVQEGRLCIVVLDVGTPKYTETVSYDGGRAKGIAGGMG